MPQNSSTSSLLGRLSARSSFISPKDVNVTVQLLNDSDSIANEFKRSQPAQAILDYICELRCIKEKDYLGLRYQDHNKHRYWVDLSRPIAHIAKQFKSGSLALRLRFRYYPSEPSHLRDGVSRYQLFMQLQRDLLHGRLYCPQSQAAELAALILQAQLGDYNEAKHIGNYVSQYKLLLKQTPRLEERIAEIHKSLRGKATSVAELEFLEKASRLDTYGFDPYTLKDAKDPSRAIYLGASSKGILIFSGNQKVHHISWSYLSKVDYIGKDLYVYPMDAYVPPICSDSSDGMANNTNQTKDRKSRMVLKYHCPSSGFSKHLWNHILSQQAFFNEQSALTIKPKFSKPRIPLLSRGSTFRYPSRRVLREIESADIPLENEVVCNGPMFERFELPRQQPRTDQPWLNKYQTMPNIKRNHNNNEINNVGHNVVKDAIEAAHITTKDASSSNTTQVNNGSEPVAAHSFHRHHRERKKRKATLQIKSIHKHLKNMMETLYTSFTVRLVKFERSPTASPEPQESSDVCVKQSRLDVQSLTKSDSSSAEVKTANGTNYVVSENGNIHLTDDKSRRSITWCANFFFSTILLMTILIVFLIAIFERDSETDWIKNIDWLSHVQHNYYEPTKQLVMGRYKKYF
ncbi:FERM central domain protein [Dictyocaulus viviparus]|uniref:FERM central domain protein n=1 Tax=Dictyocaulus viviparus TaxID=29172 RepID=A0A0D8Y927_DICVI|nr:FERM central domain protein [Dictyocaulus viviparus]